MRVDSVRSLAFFLVATLAAGQFACGDDTLQIPTIGSANLLIDFDSRNTNATMDGQAVTSWTNIGTLGSAMNANAVSGQPTPVLRTNVLNGHPTVHFTGDFLRTATVPGGQPASVTNIPTSIWAVVRVNGNATLDNQYLYSTANGEPDRHDLLFNSANRVRPYNGNNGSAVVVAPRDQFDIWRLDFIPGGGDSFYLNTTEYNFNDTADDFFNGLTLGGRFSNSTPINDAEIAQLLVFDDIPNEADADLIGGFLSYRFGLQGTGFTEFTPPLTPEPGGLILFTVALVGVGLYCHRQRRTAA